MIIDLLMTVLGLGILLLGGEGTLRGAIGLARLLGVSPAMIGLTVVAFGTSAPELVVSLEASIAGSPAIAIGNVIGSNIANIMLILGAGAIIAPLVCDPRAVRRDATAMLAALVLLVGLGISGAILAWQGVLMIAVLVVYVMWSYRNDRNDGSPVSELHVREAEETAGVPRAVPVVAFYVVGGLLALIGGAKLLVDGAVGIARTAGVSESVIGLSLVAVGTSLPELTATAVAAWRRHTDVAVANILGSNLFNVLLILGAASLAAPLPISPDFIAVDLWVMLAAGVVLIPIMVTGWHISRSEGALLLTLYALYIASLATGIGRPI
ncbi:MAG TPA: calcium/sodium antiporter [Alphaproteobacteria bacterium]|mgnify:CR=1 FL=1|nr:calcium/sodium antiporter [Alphaproteobacteria bacterium]